MDSCARTQTRDDETMKTKAKRKRPIEKSHFGQLVDLNSLDCSDDVSASLGDDLWTKQFEKSEVSRADAEAMFRRMEASNRKFPI
jgi:hypothetical protein